MGESSKLDNCCKTEAEVKREAEEGEWPETETETGKEIETGKETEAETDRERHKYRSGVFNQGSLEPKGTTSKVQGLRKKL